MSIRSGDETDRPPHEEAPLCHGVVIACPSEGDRWLMIRRAWTLQRSPGKIGFPGGEVHLEEGETQQEAAVREAREELAIDVEPLRCFWRYHWQDKGWMLWGWLARITGGDLRPNPEEVAEVLWLDSQEGAAHPDALPTHPLFLAALDKARGRGDTATWPSNVR